MPNWSFNTVAIRGKKNEVINFLNEGLKRSHGRKKNFALLPEGASTEQISEALAKYPLTLRSWLPMPRTFIKYDTTNQKTSYASWLCREKTAKLTRKWNEEVSKNIKAHLEANNERLMKQAKSEMPNEETEWKIKSLAEDMAAKELYPEDYAEYKKYSDGYDNAKVEQAAKYGCVGWYDYNCATLGTKWDSRVESWKIVNDSDDWFVLTFYCETAWSLPYAWVGTVQKQHDGRDTLRFFCYATEESYAYLGFMDGFAPLDWVENHEYENCVAEAMEKLKEENPDTPEEELEDSEELWDMQTEIYNEFCDEVFGRFMDYVNGCYEPCK